MAFYDDKRTLFAITSDGLKNLSVALTIAATLFGLVRFAVARIEEYDSYAPRLAKLEARESAVHSLIDNSKVVQLQIDASKNDIGVLKGKVDSMSTDIVNLRLSDERIRTLVEKKR